MANLCLPKSRTLQRKGEFKAVFDARLKGVNRNFVVYGRKNELKFSRLGMAVSRKFGGAVQRNRARRLIRESFRLSQFSWPIGYDWVVIPRRDGFPNRLVEVQAALGHALRKVASRPTS